MKSREYTAEIPLEAREAVGERVIGREDPRTMSQEAFSSSGELLFHGSANPLAFQHEFDYRSEAYHQENDGSKTLGYGFYATDSREDAEHYS